MTTFLKQVPVPMSGLALALLSLGNLFQAVGVSALRLPCGVVGIGLILLLLAKLCLTPKATIEQLKNPLVLAVSPTFTMAIMVGTTYLRQVPLTASLAAPIWLLAYALQIGLMISFLYHVILRQSLSWTTIFPSWFIIFVGMGVAPVTGGAVSPFLSQLALGVSFICFLLFLPIALYRIFKVKAFTEATRPLIAITCAPASLLLAGYLALNLPIHLPYLILWLLLAQGLYFMVLSHVKALIPETFYPTWAALTFPFVISATALNSAIAHFPPTLQQVLTPLAIVEILVATLMVGLALYHYLRFLFQLIKEKKQA